MNNSKNKKRGGQPTPSAKTLRNRRKRQRKRRSGTAQRLTNNTLGRGLKVSFPQCVLDYARSISDPFIPLGACVPTFPAFPSEKVITWVKGTVAIGVNGIGFVIVDPIAANDLSGVVFSTTLYPGLVFTLTPGTGVIVATTNSPYKSADFPAFVKVRPVSCGIRIRYSGTELSRGGTYYLLEEISHGTLVGAGVNNLMVNDNCRREQVDRLWHSVVAVPVDLDELDYNHQTLGQLYSTNGFLGILLAGTPGNTYDFEVFINFEAIGPNVRGKTVTETDNVAFNQVLGAFTALTGQAMPPDAWFRAVMAHISRSSTPMIRSELLDRRKQLLVAAKNENFQI